MPSILLALLTIVNWSSLAFLTVKVARLPSTFSVGVALTIGGLVGLARVRDWKIPRQTLLIGVCGIFGYHALLFAAFRLAPAVEVNLINYLWPLLIVLLSPLFLRGHRIKAHNAIGAALGLCGVFLIASGGRVGLELVSLPGYLLAAAAALIWASYSLLTKRVAPFPTGAVGAFCLVSGILSMAVSLAAAAVSGNITALVPRSSEWLFLAILGLGPMGSAFYTWDAALKRGDPRIIGALSYLTPLLSTLNLVVFGGKRLTPLSALAMALIIAGAVVGSLGGIGGSRFRAARHASAASIGVKGRSDGSSRRDTDQRDDLSAEKPFR